MLCDSDRCFSAIMWQQHSKHSIIPIVSAQMQTYTPPPPRSLATEDEETDSLPQTHEHGDPQKHQLLEALEKCGWVQAKAARLLGITPRQMGYAFTKYGINVKRY